MRRSLPVLAVLALVLTLTTACTNKKVKNPLADLGSKQPDKVLFDRSMDALKHNRFDVARMTLQTLINTYPDSEYIARAKLAVGDSWYAEGGSAALTQAEIEYKDFITFFPQMPEAAEAQYKIANIHYQQMEKPDRDFTHAARAEYEYRQMIMQFPDSPLVPEAKQHLMEVQEVLAEREFRVGRFYYLRGSFPAAIARLKSVADRYPMYSGADEALYLLGQSYEGEIATIRSRKLDEAAKARAIKQITDEAAEAYGRILTRYPVMDRAKDAKVRLEALHRPVPTATPEAIALNRKEQESREETGMIGHMLGNFRKRPDISQTARVGEPVLVDPKPTNATEVIQRVSNAMAGTTEPSGAVSVETVKPGAQPPPNQPVPRSDNSGSDNSAPAEASPYGELKPNTPPDTSAATNSAEQTASPPPPAAPQQMNEMQSEPGTSSSSAQAKPADSNEKPDPNSVSSSKPKKKKGLRKVVPF
jgi:outer membrane protein assembly factor BamD